MLSHRWDNERSRKAGPAKPKPGSEKTLAFGGQNPADEFVIRVELNIPDGEEGAAVGGAKRPKRASRLWVREKKGKRWVENDYKEVLDLLRKL